MQAIDLPVQTRTASERPPELRQGKFLPGVVYGRGRETRSVKMPYQSFRKVFEKGRYSTLVSLDIDQHEKLPVLIHEVQHHPVTDEMIHVDFYAVNMNEKVTTHVALTFVGVSEAVRQGAILQTNKHQVEISCLPKDLVNLIEVDLSALQKLNDTIRLKHLKTPEGVTILGAPEEPIVSAVELKIIEEVPVEAAPVPGAEAPQGGAAEGAPAPGAAQGGADAAKGAVGGKEGEKKEPVGKEGKEGKREAKKEPKK